MCVPVCVRACARTSVWLWSSRVLGPTCDLICKKGPFHIKSKWGCRRWQSSFLLLFCSTEEGTQDLAHARQVSTIKLYQELAVDQAGLELTEIPCLCLLCWG